VEDDVVISGALTGTNTGVFAPMKLNKTGKAVSVPMVEIDRLADGRSPRPGSLRRRHVRGAAHGTVATGQEIGLANLVIFEVMSGRSIW
jgi:hypothetical protein